MEGGHPALTLALALAVGVFAQSVARHLRVPGIVLLLLAGVGLGPDGLGWVQPRDLGDGLLVVVELAVAVILFEGGLNLEISRLRREQAPIRRLATGGALVTLVGGGIAARLLLDWPWLQSFLFGSLVVVTGPTVVGPLVRNLRLKPRVATVLEAEGVLIDPIGAILAVLMFEITLAPTADGVASEATTLIYRLGFGTLAGALAGFAISRLLKARRVIPEGYENIFVLASILLLFAGCQEILSESGILAVTVCGVVLGNTKTLVDRDLREFKDQLTVMLIGLLFVLLAADVRLAEVRDLGTAGVLVVAALIVVVRPLNVWLSTADAGFSRRERALIGWLAPRGIIAAAIASAVAVAFEHQGIPGGSELRALVFLTIAVTVTLAGLTAGPVATLLGQRLPGRDTVAILGAQGLGLALAEELRAGETPVVFFDSNPRSCRRAEELGFPVIFGDVLQDRTLQRARLEIVGAVIGLTPNQMLNSVFVSRARTRFGVPSGYVAVAKPEAGLAPELVESEEAVVLFDGPHDVERWDVRSRHGMMRVEHWERGAAPSEDAESETPAAAGAEHFVVLSVRRGKRTIPMQEGMKLREGDVAAIAVFAEERDEAVAELRRLGWREAPEAGAVAEDEDGKPG